MSREATNWALWGAPGVPAQCVSVLIGLADAADPRGQGAYLGQAALAKIARKGDRQVRKDLVLLCERGLIRRGNQALAAHIPADARPVVYDLAMDRNYSSARNSGPGRTQGSGRKPRSGRTSQGPDQQEPGGTGTTVPPGTPGPAGTTGSFGRNCSSDKPSTKPKEPSPTEMAQPDTAQLLVGEWIDHCRKRPPERVIGQVARELGLLLAEGQDPADVRRGLARWHQASKHPSTLASFVHEVMNGSATHPAGNGVRLSTTDERVAQAQALKGEMNADPGESTPPNTIPGSVIR